MEQMLCLWITATTTEADMTHMHNHPHSGSVPNENSDDVTVTEVAVRLGDKRVTVTRFLNGITCITPDLAHRLGHDFDTSPKIRAGMQMQYDLNQAGRLKHPKVERIGA